MLTDDDLKHLDSLHPMPFLLRERLNDFSCGLVDRLWQDHGEPMPKEGTRWMGLWDDITLVAHEVLNGGTDDDNR